MSNIKAAVALLALGLAAYANAIFHPFVHDDIFFIAQNPAIGSFDLGGIFFGTSAHHTERAFVNAYYRPLLEIFYRLEYRIFHLDPAGYHFVNILVHILNSFLVYYLVSLLRRDRKTIAFGVAVLFLLHPVQTEAVACVAGISNLLFSFFCLLSFIFYIRSSAYFKRDPQEFLFYIYALLFFILALLSKEQAAVLAFLIVCYEFFPGRGQVIPLRTRVLRVLGFFAVLAGYLLWRKILFGVALFTGLVRDPELFLRLWSIPQTLLMFLRVIIFPVDLHYYRNINILEPALIPSIILVLVMIILGSIIWTMKKETRVFALFGLGWFIVALLPTINIMPLVNEFSFVQAAEHFLYFPLVGLLFFIFEAGDNWLKDESSVKWMVTGALASACLITTIQQNTYWRGEVPLFERTVRFEHNFGRGRLLLGRAYYFNGQFDKAIGEYQKALEIMKGYAARNLRPTVDQFYLGLVKGIHFDLAHCYEDIGNLSKSIEHYLAAIKIDPGDSALYNNLGFVYLKFNDFDNAIGNLDQAITLDPDNLMAMNNLATAYIYVGKPEEAKGIWEMILQRNPDFLPAKENLTRFLSTQ